STLRRLSAGGLAVVFISHKLAEVMAISQRVVVMRGGKVVAELATAMTDHAELAQTMVGRPIPPTVRQPLPAGEPVLELRDVWVSGGFAQTALEGLSLTVRRHQLVGIAGVSGNGQGALFSLLSGLVRPERGEFRLFGKAVTAPSPAGMVEAGVGRIPEDRHRDGVVSDMAVWENLMLEDYRQPQFQKAGFVRRRAAQARAQAIIQKYDLRCPGPEAPTRLLSGGNMQKLILGRVLEREPGLILANQPSRGLDVGAVTYVRSRLLEARTAGAGIILMSEDLDELLALSDFVAVLYRGRCSLPLAVEEVTIGRLGLMMAGSSFAEAADAA
ncbi:MAG: ATP-binding cassette domain-containing protein, partial [Deinococcota bacterium]|nr:ATP-binding cassette domain-containing protein [Deinococcota bacterium]